jgi:tRNA A37 threonylcarbamoyladenosine modification protein TsaB
LAAARAWGKAFDRRVRGVSVLEAMVNKVRLTSDLAFPLLDARRGEFFVGSFRKTTPEARAVTDVAPGFSPAHAALKDGATPSETGAATGLDYEPADGGWVLKPESLRGFVEERIASGTSATCLVRAHDQAAADLRASLPTSLQWQTVEGTLVESIAEIAWKEELASCPSSAANLDAYYIRRPDAEVNWKD